MKLTETTDASAWDTLVLASDDPHPLQLWGWGELKRQNGWQPYRLLEGDRALAQMLIWTVPQLGWKLAYIPRGPLRGGEKKRVDGVVLQTLRDFAADQGAFCLQIEPGWAEEASWPDGWRQSRRPILMHETFAIDLGHSEDELLAAMARKTRQYIRKSAHDGVLVERDRDGRYLDQVLDVYSQTAQRAGFGLQTEHYYRTLFTELGEQNAVYVALIDKKVEAFLWLATAGRTAFELYGGVTATGERLRANYTLKWSAMQQMKAAGVTYYDFNGNLHDGVGRFKQSFGPEFVRYTGSWEYALKPAQYQFFTKVWPLAKPIGRFLMRK